MQHSPDSPQAVWQALFQQHPLTPFDAEKTKLALRYHNLNDPKFWWYNPLNEQSLRLTRVAFNTLEKAKVPNWKFRLDRVYLPKTYLQMERYFTAPYYIHGHQTIYVYGETEAMMLGLHGSNLQQYLDNHDTHG